MKPFRTLALRYTCPVPHGALVEIMQKFPFEFCANLGDKRCTYPDISKGNQPWFNSSNTRYGLYKDTDPETLLPLDEELVNRMHHCEDVFINMVQRHEYARTVSHEKRKQVYLRHLRFWNDFLESNAINLVLASTLPHEIPDHIIYCLCKDKKIPFIFSHTTPISDTAFLQDDIEESAVQIKQRLDEIKKENPKEITLCDQLEEYSAMQTKPEGKFTSAYPSKPQNQLQIFARRILSAPGELLNWLLKLFSIRVWMRRFGKLRVAMEQKRLREFYDEHAVEPDLSKQFIYFPLQFQPECSTCPMAGAFVDQQLTTQMLSQAAPRDVLIYVKEHPRQRKQGIMCRDIDFYKKLVAMPNVRLMKHESSTFKLRENCKAVATGTGTAGLEALFRQKPVLLFGHVFYQYADGVFPIRAKEDLTKAMKAIFENNEKPSQASTRQFMKAVEDTRMYATITYRYQAMRKTELSDDHSKKVFTDALTKKLQTLK
ncbi:MAG: hypothetical protein QF442_03690 [Candidatus Peribacteraceae bacterium]|jgi:hypothetical protein|nr:hypothetical protein [Candidatus Peribacteraceae bacterium]